jgi:hypothetical protein
MTRLLTARRAKVRARAQAQSHQPGKMNRTEAAYAEVLRSLLKLGEIADFAFEPVRLRIGKDWKTSYTPDFLVLTSDGLIEAHEVKGFWRDDARVKIKVAAHLYPAIKFIAVSREKGAGWKREEF